MTDTTLTPKVELEFNKAMQGIVKITCPKCRRSQKKPLRSLHSGHNISCPCGATFHISGDGFRSVQRSFDKLKRTLDNFGK